MKGQTYNVGMEAAKTIYKILSAFEEQLDNVEFNTDLLDYKAYKVSEIRFVRYLQMLINAGYIDGIKITPLSDNTFYVNPSSPTITLKGIEYLADNSVMQKVVGFIKKGEEITIPALV